MLKSVWLEVDGSPMEMLVALPAGDARRPGILLSHYQHGLGPFTRRNAERLAAEGYVVVAPDHYHHTPGETDLKKRKVGLIDTRIIADMVAATDYLRAHPRTIPDRTAIMGHCMGGRQSLLGAATIPGFACAIDCYGGGVMRAQGEGPTVFERLSGIKCPVAGFFGVHDTNPPPEDVRKVEAELKRLGLKTDFHIYDDTGHAFMDPDQKRYVEASATDAWTRISAFLAEHLAHEPATKDRA
ncbi:MAG: dienelactone hydrolase family protein [Beijerinckiaceae bacterium]|nr:dienelactone hydrolase family protein [Beijerinckiaceae bacterium]